MISNVTATWHDGLIPDDHVKEVAELFVLVDDAFGDEPWWFDVRNEGIMGAAANVDQAWTGYVTAVGPDGELVGFGAMAAPVGESVELSRIMVRPSWRGQGVAKSILGLLKDAAFQHRWSPWVDVLETSHNAINLYHAEGFETVGYQYGRDSGRLARQMRYKTI